MPSHSSQEYLLEYKIGSLLALKKFLNHQYARHQRGLNISKVFDENPYVWEMFNSNTWWKNFSLLESFWTKVELRPTLPWETAKIIEKFTKKEIVTTNRIFSELLIKLKVVEDELIKIYPQFTLEDVLNLSAEAIEAERKFTQALKSKYGLA